MNIEPLDIEENPKMDDVSYKRYNVGDKDREYSLQINDDEENEDIHYIRKERNCKIKLPFMLYILIFTGILCLGILIALILVLSTYKENYKFEENIYLKPSISEHNYSKIMFNNGLNVVLTQINFDDLAGGAITFDTGYLDRKYEPGLLHLAFLSLRYNNDTHALNFLNDYMGNLNQSSEEFYSSTYFTILNSGFQKFFKNFKNYNTFKPSSDYNAYIFRRLNRSLISSLYNNSNEREKHLIEYLIYNISDREGNDIWRQGIGIEINKTLDNNFTKIEQYINELFNPKKIKMFFSSHYKMSLMRKYILRYFNQFTNLKEVKEETNNKSYYDILNTNKIIYHQINNNEKNYIKINYYIKNPDASLEQLYIDSGYFNYIKYILDETNKSSLYYNLTHPENKGGLNIKDLSSNFEIVLKKYIRFSILIGLNEFSLNHTKEIIEIIYNHMEMIKNHINKINLNDKRAEELFNITEKNFTYTEDVHEGDYYKNKAKDLFYRDIHDYYLKEVWVPSDFNKNYTMIKYYLNQLTQNNSVVIIGINQDTINLYELNNSDNQVFFIYNNLSITTNYSNIIYSINDLSKLKLNISNVTSTLSYHPNEYISEYTNYKINKKETPKEGKYENNSLVQINWRRKTSFGIPKVYVTLYLFHPFIRANITKEKEKGIRDDCFFNMMIYLAYLRREINLVLADAIRAGNTFKIDFSEYSLYIDIFAYSDKIEKILEIIKKIIVCEKKDIFINNFILYRDIALDDILNNNNADVRELIKYEFFTYITNNSEYKFPSIYNHYLFPRDKYLKKTNINDSFLKPPILKGYIYGFCDEDLAKRIYDSFSDEKFNYSYYHSVLDKAQYDFKIEPKDFVKLSLNKYRLNRTFKIKVEKNYRLNNRKYAFMFFSVFTYKNRIISEILKKLFPRGTINSYIHIENIVRKNIYLRISFLKNDTTETTEDAIESIKNEISKKEDEFMRPVDIIGGRYYYLTKNMENEYNKDPYGMRSNAVYYASDRLYGYIEVNSYEIDKYKYETFSEVIKKIFDDVKYYCEFSN